MESGGAPPGDPSESRPLSFASVFLRAWHRCLLQYLLFSSPRHWREDGVTRAFVDWASFCGDAGNKIDLTAAFNMIEHGMASTAFAMGRYSRAWLGTAAACVVGSTSLPSARCLGVSAASSAWFAGL